MKADYSETQRKPNVQIHAYIILYHITLLPLECEEDCCHQGDT